MSDINMSGLAGRRQDSIRPQSSRAEMIREVLFNLMLTASAGGLLTVIYFEMASKLG